MKKKKKIKNEIKIKQNKKHVSPPKAYYKALLKKDKLKKDLFNLRFQKINSQITNPAKIGETKKIIARLKTTLKRKIDA